MDFSRIDRVLEEMTETGAAAGGSCLVYQGGQVQYYGERGYADLENRKPVRRDTIFRLYSMSKPMTAAAAMILVQEGRMDLTSPVSEYLPSFKNPRVADKDWENSHPAQREICIHDLLNMTSGLTYDGDTCRTERDTAKLVEELEARLYSDHPMTTREVADRLAQIPLAAEPGEQAHYGMSADVLGAVIEQVSGQRFSEFVQERLLEPLGMKDTGYYVPADKQDRLSRTYQLTEHGLKQYTGTHLGICSRMEIQPAFESGGAGLASTVDDWLRFCRMLRNGGALDQTRILSASAVRFLTRSTITEMQRTGFSTWNSMAGYSYGNYMRILTEPEHADTFGCPGEFGWDGWLGPYMTVAPEKDLILLIMLQLTDAGSNQYTRRIRNIVYSSID